MILLQTKTMKMDSAVRKILTYNEVYSTSMVEGTYFVVIHTIHLSKID